MANVRLTLINAPAEAMQRMVKTLLIVCFPRDSELRSSKHLFDRRPQNPAANYEGRIPNGDVLRKFQEEKIVLEIFEKRSVFVGNVGDHFPASSI